MSDFSERKRELMKRDPVAQGFEKDLKKMVSGRHDVLERMLYIERPLFRHKKLADYVDINAKMLSNAGCKKELIQLLQQVVKKWTGVFRISNNWKIEFIDNTTKVKRASQSTNLMSYDEETEINEIHPELMIWKEAPFTAKFFELPILINVLLVDSHDESEVKRNIWRMIQEEKEYLKRMYEVTRSHQEDLPPYDKLTLTASLISQELVPIFHMREDTFKRYLGWYDIYTNKRFSFRSIAIIARILKRDPKEAEQATSKIELKGRRMKGGQPVKGEDAVRRGILIIHEAIHRKKMNPADLADSLQEYSCSQHANNCPNSCDYFKKWQKQFDRCNPVH